MGTKTKGNNSYKNDKNMLYFYCVTVFQPKLDHTQIEIENN